jgi:hypothetical protein
MFSFLSGKKKTYEKRDIAAERFLPVTVSCGKGNPKLVLVNQDGDFMPD